MKGRAELLGKERVRIRGAWCMVGKGVVEGRVMFISGRYLRVKY